jgi:hypothetical protein
MKSNNKYGKEKRNQSLGLMLLILKKNGEKIVLKMVIQSNIMRMTKIHKDMRTNLKESWENFDEKIEKRKCEMKKENECKMIKRLEKAEEKKRTIVI